jgi:hypothetical protein
VSGFDGHILSFCTDCARVWGHLCCLGTCWLGTCWLVLAGDGEIIF